MLLTVFGKARISRLDYDCQNALTMASFIGNDFTFEALCAVTGLDEGKALEIMEKTLKTGLIKERVVRGVDIFSFSDVIIRDVVHEEVSHLRHGKLHGSVGSALEKAYAKKLDEHLGELAYHFLESGDKEKALGYFFKAGEKAQNVYALDEAISYFHHALELIEETEGSIEEKARVNESLGDLEGWIGKVDDGVEYLRRSLTFWNQLGDKKNVARIHSKLASLAWQFLNDGKMASEHHRMALEILEKKLESVELARLYEDIAHMLWRTGSPEAWSWAKKALELAEKTGATEVIAWCYNDLGTLYMKSGELEKSSEYYEQGLKTALESNFAGPAITIYNNLLQNYWIKGEFEKAFQTVHEGSEYAKKAGALHGLTWLNGMEAGGHMLMGELHKAISILEDNLALAKRFKYEVQISGSLGGLGSCYLLLGEWDKSLQFLKESLDIAKRINEYQFSGEAARGLGELFTEMEDYDEAEKYLQEGKNIYQSAQETNALHEDIFPEFSKLYLKKGEIKKAEELIEKIYEYATKARSRFVTPYADMLKAMLLREQKNWDLSIQHFEKSLEGYRSLNAQKWYAIRFAELLYEYGLVYLQRNNEGDRERAYSLLDQALAIYQRIEARKNVEKILAKKKLLTA